MNRTKILNEMSRVIGYIDEETGGFQTARDSHMRIVGYYDPRSNITRNKNYQIFGYGNQLAVLIYLTKSDEK